MRADGHEHHSHPSRCCPEEDPREVLARLKQSPPERMGHKAPHGGWSGESAEGFAARVGAWEGAVKREEDLLEELQRLRDSSG